MPSEKIFNSIAYLYPVAFVKSKQQTVCAEILPQ
jgi:hypothetical protein